MTIGEIIKKYRRNMGMSQLEMANRLGVTAPAVNKWEKGNTLPDVALLAPIARLLGITTDELLSFHDELTDEEISQFLSQVQRELDNKDFHDVFLNIKTKIEEYPNCEKLIWQAAVILDAKRMATESMNQGEYEQAILGWYERCLLSENEQIRKQAADLLFHAFFRKEDYEKARYYLEYFSLDNPERKRKEALVDSKTGKREESYRAYEELLFSGYQHIQSTIFDLCSLYMEDNNHEMAEKLSHVSSLAASTFEMGKYNEVCAGLDVAVWEKDVAATVHIMQNLLDSIETIDDFTKSKLYQHMTFKPLDTEFSENLRQELLKSLEDKSYNYMQGNECWEKLKTKHSSRI